MVELNIKIDVSDKNEMEILFLHLYYHIINIIYEYDGKNINGGNNTKNKRKLHSGQFVLIKCIKQIS